MADISRDFGYAPIGSRPPRDSTCSLPTVHARVRYVRRARAERRDVRSLLLVRRKALLRRVVPANSGCVLYAEHVDGAGCALFGLVCEQDLEGIVARWKRGSTSSPRRA